MRKFRIAKEKVLRRSASIILSVIMVGSVAACGNGSATTTTKENSTVVTTDGSKESQSTSSEQKTLTAEDGATIKFTYWEGSPSDKAAWDVVLANFQKDHPEITLQAEAYPSTTYFNQLDTMIAGDNWPDVLRYPYQYLGKFREADVLLDITDYISTESVEDLLPAYRAALTNNGRLVGMPHHTDTMALFYNKTMFEASGIRIPTGPNDGWSWDELKEYSAKLKQDHNLPFAFGGIWEEGIGSRYLPFVYMNNGSLLNEDGTKVTADTPEFLEAVQLYGDLRDQDLILNNGFLQPPQVNSMFVAKQLGFVFAGSWHCSFMEQNMSGEWGVTYMPQVDGKSGSDMGGNSLIAHKDTEYPVASAIFIDYITQAENMKIFCEEGGFLPVRQSLSAENITYKNFPEEMGVFLEIVGTVDPKLTADVTSNRFQRLNVAFSEIMDPLAVAGAATPEQVVEQLQAELQAILDE